MVSEVLGTQLTVGEVAKAMEGRLMSGSLEIPVDAVSIDTRSASRGDLFFAIQGNRFDGHHFVDEAIGRGACGAVVSESFTLPPSSASSEPVMIVVSDTVRALQLLGRHVRRQSGSKVVAITGSAGKTSTKEMTADLLSGTYRVVRNEGNLNNHIGLPLSLIKLLSKPDVAVVELGMSQAGEIGALVAIAEPEVRVWTNVSEAHLSSFDSIEHIADAKAEILQGAGRSDKLVANANDARVMTRAAQFAGQVSTFGVEVPADVFAEDVQDYGLDGVKASVRTAEGEFEMHVPLLGRGQLANALAAITVALQFQISLNDIATRIEKLRPLPHRGQAIKLKNGITVIDDSYNSNPAALTTLCNAVRSTNVPGRRIAVIGEMLDLGSQSSQLHKKCGQMIAACGFQELVVIGSDYANDFITAAVAAGMPPGSVQQADTSEMAVPLVLNLMQAGDLIVVKGSRGIRTDIVVEGITRGYA